MRGEEQQVMVQGCTTPTTLVLEAPGGRGVGGLDHGFLDDGAVPKNYQDPGGDVYMTRAEGPAHGRIFGVGSVGRGGAGGWGRVQTDD